MLDILRVIFIFIQGGNYMQRKNHAILQRAMALLLSVAMVLSLFVVPVGATGLSENTGSTKSA